MKRTLMIALCAVLAAMLASPVAYGQAGQDGTTSGKTVELAAEWWIWALSKPSAENPLIGEDPDYTRKQCDGRPVDGSSGKVWFLAGTLDETPVDRTCTVPPNRELFFPVGNVAFLITEPGETEEDAHQYVNGYMDEIEADKGLVTTVTVDGEEFPDERIERADSPLFTAKVPKGGLLEAGSYEGVADGLWVTLPPLPKGEHTVHFSFDAPNAGFSQNNTYHLTVAR